MNNKKRGSGSLIKRFVGNRNTVTFLGLLACVAVLIIGYNYRVNVAISPVSVPYAKQDLPARQLITSDMLGVIKIASTYTTTAKNLVQDSSKVVNKYVSYKTNIPKGSLFYNEQLLEAEDMPDAAFSNIPDGYTIYSLAVDEKSSYFNSIRAGDYIDLYVGAIDKDGNKLIFAKLIESIRVLVVKDSNGVNITKNRLDNGKPSELLFAVEEANYILLMQAENVKDVKFEIEPVPRNSKYTQAAGNTQVSSEELKAYIERYCEMI